MKPVPNTMGLASINAAAGSTVQTEDRSQTKTNFGFLAALAANILWGASFLASKATLGAWGPLGASTLRFIVASLLLGLGLLLVRGRIAIPKSLAAWVRVSSVAFVGFALLYPIQLAGLKLIPSGFSAAIMLTSPLFVILGGVLFLGESFARNKLLAVGIGMAGGAVLLSESIAGHQTMSNDFLLGSALTLLASLSLATSVILTRKASRDIDAGSLTFWTMLLGALGIGLLALIFEPEFSIRSLVIAPTSAWVALIFLALICSALCFFMWNFALAKASPKEIASTMHIKTPTAIMLGCILAGEPMSLSLVAGTVIVSAGLYLSQKRETVKGSR